MDFAIPVAIGATAALIAWLAYLVVAAWIVERTGSTRGLRDLGVAAALFRRRQPERDDVLKHLARGDDPPDVPST